MPSLPTSFPPLTLSWPQRETGVPPVPIMQLGPVTTLAPPDPVAPVPVVPPFAVPPPAPPIALPVVPPLVEPPVLAIAPVPPDPPRVAPVDAPSPLVAPVAGLLPPAPPVPPTAAASQIPAEHFPLWQTFPHCPQCSGLSCKFTVCPAQTEAPLGLVSLEQLAPRRRAAAVASPNSIRWRSGLGPSQFGLAPTKPRVNSLRENIKQSSLRGNGSRCCRFTGVSSRPLLREK